MNDRHTDTTAPVDVAEKPAPWGFWATMGLSAGVYLLYFALSLLVGLGYGAVFLAANPGADGADISAALSSGFVAFLGLSLAAPLCTGLVLLLARWKATLPVRAYLCLRPAGVRTLLAWFGLLILLLAASDVLTYLLDRPISPDVMTELYRTSRYAALAWFAIVLAGPVFEEVLFRGFMFRGIQASRLGNAGAIAITAALWAVTHVQYDAYLIATIFALGILLGAARARTGSLYLTIAMHMVTNLIATIEIQLLAGPGGPTAG